LQDEVELRMQRDPQARLRRHLVHLNLLDDAAGSKSKH
jgi:TPP-dependent pyruvate/acetoin dehydrogenase alpha subunit